MQTVHRRNFDTVRITTAALGVPPHERAFLLLLAACGAADGTCDTSRVKPKTLRRAVKATARETGLSSGDVETIWAEMVAYAEARS